MSADTGTEISAETDNFRPKPIISVHYLLVWLVSLRAPTVETNQCQDFTMCQDQLIETVDIFSAVKTRFFSLVWKFLVVNF